MSAEQSAGETPTAQTPVDITERATNPAPKPREKNPKRVAAGKLVAERTRIARQQQKKAAAEASVIIANNNAKQPPPPPDPAPENLQPPYHHPMANGWQHWSLALLGIYYKREELKVRAKTFFGEKKGLSQTLPPPHSQNQNLLV